jgi:hypothetical protein
MPISRMQQPRQMYQEGGIMPRLNQLGSSVSSAEQTLQQINQRLQSAESSLGEGGGGFGSGGPLDQGIGPDQLAEAKLEAMLPGMRPGNIPGTNAPYSSLRGSLNQFTPNMDQLNVTSPLQHSSGLYQFGPGRALTPGQSNADGSISPMQSPLAAATGRQNYGLGSFVKKVTGKVTKPFTKVAKKIVPKEIAGIMRAAAPFLPPGYREAAYLLGTAKQTGRISPMDLALTALPYANKALGSQKSLPLMERKGFFAEKLPGANKFLFGSPEQTLGGTLKNQVTQDATTGIFGSGGKMFQFGDGRGFTAFKDQTKLGDLLLGGEDGGFSKSKIAGLGVGVLSLIQSAKTPEEAGDLLVSQTGNSDDYERGFKLFSQLDTSSFSIPDQFRLNSAKGGLMRTNYAMGSDEPKPLPNDPTEPVNPFQPKPIGPFPSKMAGIPKDLDLEKAKEMFIQFNGREPVDMQELLEFFNVKQQAAGGGLMRENFALGTRPTDQESGLGGLPIEADMRYTGGFMPYGAVEKADDVPARLSKNEFVFTADAVRAAGGGSVQKGAKKMYDTMKQLEQQPEAKGAMA